MTSTMRFDKWENSLGQPYGSVLQVVQWRRQPLEGAGGSSLLASSSGTFSTFMSASITPKFFTSKILVLVNFYTYNSSGGAVSGKSRVTRNGSMIDILTYSSFYNLGNFFEESSYTILDSPNTTSSVLYEVQGARGGGAGAVLFGYADSGGTEHASITLIEIA
jgi:hypothetical protein